MDHLDTVRNIHICCAGLKKSSCQPPYTQMPAPKPPMPQQNLGSHQTPKNCVAFTREDRLSTKRALLVGSEGHVMNRSKSVPRGITPHAGRTHESLCLVAEPSKIRRDASYAQRNQKRDNDLTCTRLARPPQPLQPGQGATQSPELLPGGFRVFRGLGGVGCFKVGPFKRLTVGVCGFRAQVVRLGFELLGSGS